MILLVVIFHFHYSFDEDNEHMIYMTRPYSECSIKQLTKLFICNNNSNNMNNDLNNNMY